MIRIYLDNCCFNRPFDDMGNINIRLESIAKLHIQNLIRNEKLELAWSYLLESENDQNPFLDKKISIAAWKDISTINIEESEELLLKSEEYSNSGIKPLDSIHIACAYFMNCHYFLTTDKGILNKSQYVRDIQILNPIEFFKSIGGTMKTDTEIRVEGMNILMKYMNILDAERFVSIIQTEKFDYTKWRQNLWTGLSVREISKRAMDNIKQKKHIGVENK